MTEANGVIPLADEELNPVEPEVIETADAEASIPEDAPVETQDGDVEAKAETDEDKASKRQGYRQRARTARVEKENRELREQIAQREAERQSPALKEPDRDEYNDYEQYLEARAEWKAETIVTTKQQEIEAKVAERERVMALSQTQAQWEDSQDDSRELHEDFDDVVYGDDNIVTDEMAMSIKSLKNGGEVAYALAKDTKEAARIAALPPLRQIMAIGAIEERLKASAPKPKPPTPISRGRTSQSTTSNRLNDNMPMDEWVAARNKQAGR